MKFYIQLTLSVLALTFFTSCTSKQAILNKNYESRPINIYGKLDSLQIVDERDDVTDRPMFIPFLSMPDDSDMISPKLTPSQSQAITSQIRSYFKGGERDFKVKCRITKAFTEFSAKAFSEREYVHFETTIELMDEQGVILQSCDSAAFFETKSMDASAKMMTMLYEKAMRVAIYKCFEKLTDRP
ncbi:MAG: hypothetical protein KDC49_05805 [Saprospiraceae bacterium]|nr:hypothetical protein [Saprospiraceae bacterium]